jgi:NTE family protein
MNAASVLAASPLFSSLGGEAQNELAALAARLEVGSGQRLYGMGEPPTHLYVVASGRLRVQAGARLLGYVSRGEPVGEIGVLTGDPRTSNVHAIRDTVLYAIERAPFLALCERYPAALLELTRLLITRLRQYQGERRASATGTQGTFAVIPASPAVPVQLLGEALVRGLSGWPRARLVTAAHVDATLGAGTAYAPLADLEAGRRVGAWLADLEAKHRYLVLAADGERDPWALRCLRHADRVLVLAEAQADPGSAPVLPSLDGEELLAPVELVLLRSEGDPSPRTLAWRERTGARAHYFVHPWHAPDLAALARQITGRGVGLVLGGGGARGFAHIGLMRALEQLEIDVDVLGGTSMGAFVSALAACGFDSVEMTHIARETFVAANYLNDYNVPRVSLIRGRKFYARLREIFGERAIEELRRTYFCMSSNLTSGSAMVHDRGTLAAWVGTSMSVPGIAPPIAYEGELLCDGGVIDNLPTGVMQSLERGLIIASNVSTEGEIRATGAGLGLPDPEFLLRRRRGASALPSLREILLRTATLGGEATLRQAAERADLYIRMPVQDFRVFDWGRLDELVEIGYRQSIAALAPIRDKLTGRAA